MKACLIAAGLLSLACAAPAAGELPLWADLADTGAVATPASWAVNPAAPAVDD